MHKKNYWQLTRIVFECPLGSCMEIYLLATARSHHANGDPICDPQETTNCVRQYMQGFAYAGVHHIDKGGIPNGFVQSQFFHKEDVLIHPSIYRIFMINSLTLIIPLPLIIPSKLKKKYLEFDRHSG